MGLDNIHPLINDDQTWCFCQAASLSSIYLRRTRSGGCDLGMSQVISVQLKNLHL